MTAYVLDAVRTPFGRYGGALAGVRPDDLGAHVGRSILDRTKIDPERIDDVMFGNANGAGEDNRDVARMAVLLAGLPTSVPGTTINRLRGSRPRRGAPRARGGGVEPPRGGGGGGRGGGAGAPAPGAGGGGRSSGPRAVGA